MRTVFTFSFLLAVIVLISTAKADEEVEEAVLEERGYCAENGIKCNDLHCCTGLKCKCTDRGLFDRDCVCRKG
nr:neurotoxin icc1c.pk001.g5 [Cheiracanthium punctorium]